MPLLISHLRLHTVLHLVHKKCYFILLVNQHTTVIKSMGQLLEANTAITSSLAFQPAYKLQATFSLPLFLIHAHKYKTVKNANLCHNMFSFTHSFSRTFFAAAK